MKTTDITATLALIGVIGLAFHAFKAGGSSEKQPVLKDAIVAFESVACPTGWITHSKSEGRFLVSAGKSDDGHQFDLLGSSGNTKHSHTGTTSTAPASSGEDDTSHPRSGSHSHSFTTNGNSHLPPYYVVTFCKKV